MLRADVDPIVLGERSNLQDGVDVHTDAGHPTSIGAGVSVGHRAVLQALVPSIRRKISTAELHATDRVASSDRADSVSVH